MPDAAPTTHRSPRAAFDAALNDLTDEVLKLGARVGRAIERAGTALANRDVAIAEELRWDDAGTNELQRRINASITTMIATQQPMARDVRQVLALHHAASELERMGDYAVNIAKLVQQLAEEPPVEPFPQLSEMVGLCREQVRAAMHALVEVDEAEARAVCSRDDAIDRLYGEVYGDAVELMIRSPNYASQATHLLFIAHHLERLGDRVTNIGEDVVYLATGQVEDLNP